MDYEKRAELVKLHMQMRQATDSLHTQAREVHEMARKLEELTKDTSIRYAGLWVRAAFEQAKDLREVLDEMGKQMRGES